MAVNGDPNFTGDNFQLNSVTLTGPNNPIGNFFRGQVNDINGNLNTIGSFADRNFLERLQLQMQELSLILQM